MKKITEKKVIASWYKTFIKSQTMLISWMYGQACNSTFHKKFEYIQFDACLAETEAITYPEVTFPERYYQDLG